MPLAFLPSSFIRFLGTQAMVGSSAGIPFGFQRLEHAFVARRVGENFPLIAIVAQVVAAGIEHDAHQLIFGGLLDGNEDLAAPLEHPRDAALLAHVPAVLGERVADFADGAVAIVGRDIDQHGCAARAVAFEHDFFDLAAFQFAGAAHDRLLDVVGRHGHVLGGQNGGAQPGIAVGIAAVAGCDRDFLDEARERFSALRVGRRLLVLNGGPFGVA